MYITRQEKARLGVVKLAYEVTHPLEEERDTPGLIFVGGWGESGQTWRQQVAWFAPRFPTLTYDRRGLGQSSHPDYQDAYTMEEELADLGTVLRGHRAGRAFLVADRALLWRPSPGALGLARASEPPHADQETGAAGTHEPSHPR